MYLLCQFNRIFTLFGKSFHVHNYYINNCVWTEEKKWETDWHFVRTPYFYVTLWYTLRNILTDNRICLYYWSIWYLCTYSSTLQYFNTRCTVTFCILFSLSLWAFPRNIKSNGIRQLPMFTLSAVDFGFEPWSGQT